MFSRKTLLAVLVAFTVLPAAAQQDSFHLHNTVNVVARHCDMYRGRDWRTLWLSRRKLITAAEEKRCLADPTTVYYDWSAVIPASARHNLTTNAGLDVIKQQIWNSGSQPAACAYVAVGTTAITPTATDTSLSGEVTINGLARALGTYTSTGTGTATEAHTFTASGAVSNVQAAALFNALSGGTMCFEVGSLGPVTLATNDILTVTWSGTVS